MGKLLALLLGGGAFIGITIIVSRAGAEPPRDDEVFLSGSFTLEVAP